MSIFTIFQQTKSNSNSKLQTNIGLQTNEVSQQ